MKKQGKFTLIELLVVIGVIAILMAMLLPAIGKVRSQAKKAKARAQIKALEIAIKSYETTYGLLPAGAGDVDESNSSNNNYGRITAGAKYGALMEVLTCVQYPSGSGYKNTRQIRFIDAPEKYSTEGFVDPWGNEFKIFLDIAYAGYVKVGSTTINRSIAIYSFGPNKTDNGGSSTGGNDDITSWSE
ncbi:MAG TPA: prepilin-type N-terminal cleavage/methylation domain-containing protein [Victivallales bacterium]|nr:prepilin-type N-terminal cleavage/methylation domain-containing protein [Victivallales bacterium]HPO90197.1 prepilin-type N-terminal cleavage/methylation domain-containing protein [Victivallales bacterium]HRR06674.1 prepilin-type N-terminal cleavage/methylation domain-containing protein [Victivallales bacterium]HRR27734.1 prepilin-type N-terminal cleavage/methylation domain-containing protein [Victivallales bacterium]HRU00263.1 prepilin-type N-terminal cleavage/methylation domain-containing 